MTEPHQVNALLLIDSSFGNQVKAANVDLLLLQTASQQLSLQQMNKKQNKEKVNYNKLFAQTRVSQVDPLDLPMILRAINAIEHTPSQKSKTAKYYKNASQKSNNYTYRRNLLDNTMNEKDIDQLFIGHKRKEVPILIQEEPIPGTKDFARSVKFLALNLFGDQLLNGLPPIGQSHHESVISLLFDKQVPPDLTEAFKKDYNVGRVIGEGAYAQVRAAIYKPANKKVAVKIYGKSRLNANDRKQKVIRQIRILQNLDHPNIVKILDVRETNNHLNIVMEYIQGMPLGSFIQSQKRLSQKFVKRIIRPLAAALQYLHARHISHRDIKLDNIILDDQQNPKLIDFGFSTCVDKSEKVSIFCGTPSFMAPEIIKKQENRGQSADIWSLGVVMFIALTGQYPFRGSTDEQLFAKISSANYPKIELLSKQAVNLVSKMLTVQADKRITASGVLAHPWFKEGAGNSKKSIMRKIECQNNTNNSLSVRRSREDDNASAKKDRRLTETCYNLKRQLRANINSRSKMNKTAICKNSNKGKKNQKVQKKTAGIYYR